LFWYVVYWQVQTHEFGANTPKLAAGSIESLGPAIIADLYMERYFATAMAIFSLFLSGGSQVGPTIAGFLVKSKGWRWFFILDAILIGINLLFTLTLLPETSYKRVILEGETAAEVDKLAVEEIEHADFKTVDDQAPQATVNSAGNVHYAGSYLKDLIALKHRGLENGVAAWAKQLSLPFRFLLVPHALFAAVVYGVFLGG
jgi:MFS family permease